MKFLAVFFLLLSNTVLADQAGIDIGFGEGTRFFYGADYQINYGKFGFLGCPYIDLSVMGNKDYIQAGTAIGLQLEQVNVGFATAITNSQLTYGPELGIQQNLTDFLYIKENNTYMGALGGKFNFNATLGLGVNF